MLAAVAAAQLWTEQLGELVVQAAVVMEAHRATPELLELLTQAVVLEVERIRKTAQTAAAA
jgi:hypothetical protein